MPKLKLPLPLNGGINTQADPTLIPGQLRNARNAYYRRDDQTLRRRQDIKTVVGNFLADAFFIAGTVQFENTDKTFKWLVTRYNLASPSQNQSDFKIVDIETPVETSDDLLSVTSAPVPTKPVQYNNTLYWPNIPATAGGSVSPTVAWNGITNGTYLGLSGFRGREAGIDIRAQGILSLGINVAGAGTMSFTTGRKYTFTLYDSVNQIESMPWNSGTALTTVDTGPITNKSPVVTVTWGAGLDPNGDNTNNNHDTIRWYATTDGGVTYYFHSATTIANPNLDATTVVLTDTLSDTTLATGDILVYNSPPPPALFYAKFENKIVAGGAKSAAATYSPGDATQSNVLYYSLPDEPEHWPRNLTFNTQVNAIPFRDQDGDSLVGTIQVNRILLVGLHNSIWTINHLPINGVDPLFDLDTLKDRTVNTHGFISSRCYCALQLNDDEDAAFYVSQRGFHINNGSSDRLVSGDIKWDDTVYNTDQTDIIHVTNDTQNYIIIVAFPSTTSTTCDAAYIYHYHPSQLDEQGLGKITGPWDYNTQASDLIRRTNGNYEVWTLTHNSTNSTNDICKLSGTTGVDNDATTVNFQWETGWYRLVDDSSLRIRELNFTVQEVDTALLDIGESTVAQVSPRVRFLQANSSGPVVKVQWNNDIVTLKQITGTGNVVTKNLGHVTIENTDRAIISATLDCEAYGEEKTLASGVDISS